MHAEPQLPTPIPSTTHAITTPEGISIDIVEMLFSGLKDGSREGYRKDLAALATFLGLTDLTAVVYRLLRLNRGQANSVAAAFVADQLKRLSPATARRRYAAMARIYRAGRRLGLTEVSLEAELPRVEPLRDTAGPGRRAWGRMFDQAELEAQEGRPVAVRDRALILLMHDRALRRAEVARLDWPDDVDLARPAVKVLGKGRDEPEWLTVSDRAAAAVRAWVAVRGDWAGPLFTRCDPASTAPARLSGHGLNDVVKSLARRAGLPRTVRAHALRHQSITEALDLGWSIRDTMQFSRHIDPKTVMIYDDRRRDVGGQISRSLGGQRRASRRRG